MSAELPTVVSWVNGSVGDRVYTRNQHGPYWRARTPPTDPNTYLQVVSRRRWGQASWRWSHTITQAQRRLWRVYAAQQVEFTGSARRTALTGHQAFMRANMPRVGTALGWRDTPPTVFSQSPWTTPFNTYFPGPGVVLCDIDNTDAWATEDGGGMWLFLSIGCPSSVNFFATPFRQAKLIEGRSATPIATQHWFLDPWGPIATNRHWLKSYICRADGRVSSPRTTPVGDNV